MVTGACRIRRKRMGTEAKIDNEIYETYGDTWWDEDAEFGFSSLRYCVNPVRYRYFRKILQRIPLVGQTVLDVGCGGGFLSEELARDGFEVAGIDPSGKTIAAAQKHASESGLNIRYEVGRGEAIPFPDSSFDIVACCDVLEHVDDIKKVMGEVSRVLKPAGLFLYDTVNRTWFSKLALIKVWQEWSLTRCCRQDCHVWEKFIRPEELITLMRDHRLVHQEMRGITPEKRNLIALLRSLRAIRTGKMRNEEMTAKLRLKETGDLKLSYMGYALKRCMESGAVPGQLNIKIA